MIRTYYLYLPTTLHVVDSTSLLRCNLRKKEDDAEMLFDASEVGATQSVTIHSVAAWDGGVWWVAVKPQACILEE